MREEVEDLNSKSQAGVPEAVAEKGTPSVQCPPRWRTREAFPSGACNRENRQESSLPPPAPGPATPGRGNPGLAQPLLSASCSRRSHLLVHPGLWGWAWD